MRRTGFLLALAACAIAAPAWAQIGQDGQPLVVEAESLDVHNEQGLVVYEGRVDAVQGDTQVRANRLELYFDKSQAADAAGMGDLTQAVAIGEVYYVTPTQIAAGDHAVYDLASDTVTMTGNVIVTQGCDVVTGAEMVMNLTTRDAQVRPGAAEGARPGRVRTVIFDTGAAAEGEGEGGEAPPPASTECPA